MSRIADWQIGTRHAPHGAYGRGHGVRRRLGLIALGAIFSLTGPVYGLDAGSDDTDLIPGAMIVAQAPVDRSHGDVLPEGSRIVRFQPGGDADRVTLLTPDFIAAGRPDISFDGRRILFVGKKRAEDRFQAWEMHVDGSGLRCITNAAADLRKAIYLSTVYTIDADAPVYQIAYLCAAPDRPFGVLYTCRMDGTRVTRITFEPIGVSDPFLISDSRLLFTRWHRTAQKNTPGLPEFATDLMTINTDGTDLFPFAAVHERPAIRSMPCETRDGRIVYVESSADRSERAGALISVSRTRSLHTRRVVASDEAGRYRAPFALSDGRLLVSYRANGDKSYGVNLLDASEGTHLTKVLDDPAWDALDAMVAAPRPEPAGRSSVVDNRVDYGFLYAMDVYQSDREEAKKINPGDITTLRVYSTDAGGDGSNIGEAADHGGRRVEERIIESLLGEIPVEPDGSFYLKLPARTPIRLETLSADGTVLQAMSSTFWIMPKEGRGCIGCHEDRELTPPNRHVRALRKKPHVLGLSVTPAEEDAHSGASRSKP